MYMSNLIFVNSRVWLFFADTIFEIEWKSIYSKWCNSFTGKTNALSIQLYENLRLIINDLNLLSGNLLKSDVLSWSDIIRRYKYLLSANISSSCCFTCFTCSEKFSSCFSNCSSRAHIVEIWKSVSVFYFDESYMRGLEISHKFFTFPFFFVGWSPP